MRKVNALTRWGEPGFCFNKKTTAENKLKRIMTMKSKTIILINMLGVP